MKSGGKKDAQRAELASRLRGAGLKRTGPRVAVLEQLSRAQSPLSHGEIAQALDGAGVDRATVYRNLMDLVEAGLVARTDLGDRMWRFELRGDRARHEKKHPHLVCTDCGRVECLSDVEVQVKVVRGARRGLRTEDMEIQLRGRCEKCAA